MVTHRCSAPLPKINTSWTYRRHTGCLVGASILVTSHRFPMRCWLVMVECPLHDILAFDTQSPSMGKIVGEYERRSTERSSSTAGGANRNMICALSHWCLYISGSQHGDIVLKYSPSNLPKTVDYQCYFLPWSNVFCFGLVPREGGSVY